MNADLLKTIVVALECVLLTAACGGGAPSGAAQNSAQTGDNWSPADIQVERAKPAKKTGQSEDFPLPNCGGTGPLKISLSNQVQIEKSVTVGGTAKTSAGIEVGIPPSPKLKLEAEVQAAYQEALKQEQARLDMITMEAAAGTYVIYVIQWEEQNYDSNISFTGKGEVLRTPYTYVLQVPKLGDSRREDCPTPTGATPTSTPTPTPTPTSTPTPTEIPTPTPIDVRANKKGAEQILSLDGTETAVMLWIENASPTNSLICQSGNCTYLLRVSDQKWKMYDKNDLIGRKCLSTVPDVPEGAYRPHGDMEIVWCMLEGWKELGWGKPDIRNLSWTYTLYPDRLVFSDNETGNTYSLNQDKTWERRTAK
jgi:hypothetical protein